MLKKLTGKRAKMANMILKERTAADWCGIMCTGSCLEPDFPSMTMNVDLRFDP